MDQIVHKLQTDYPFITFSQGEAAYWSPEDNQVYYTSGSPTAIGSLLHELAHALLGHTTFTSDIDLLKKEIEAWEEARRIATRYQVHLDSEHIQDCLDTYRDWLHKRSTCPVCGLNGLQTTSGCYSCLNCDHSWLVSSSRLCRPYRLSKTTKKELT